jgi:hypothetical protein
MGVSECEGGSGRKWARMNWSESGRCGGFDSTSGAVGEVGAGVAGSGRT